MRLSLLIDNFVMAPLLNAFVGLFQIFFVGLDKIMGNEVSAVSDEEALQEYRDRTVLSEINVPFEFKALLPLAGKWGIGDDSIRGDLTDSASEVEKRQLILA